MHVTPCSHLARCLPCHPLAKNTLAGSQCLQEITSVPCAWQDYLFQYKAGIEAVTPEDILAAARRHLHPRQQAVVMAADAAVFQSRLEAAGMRVVPMTVDQ